MSGLLFSVDRVVIETEVERERAPAIAEIIREAFLRLAERWRRSPWARSLPLAAVVRDRLEIEPVSAEELLGERGAELLADRMWQALAASITEAR